MQKAVDKNSFEDIIHNKRTQITIDHPLPVSLCTRSTQNLIILVIRSTGLFIHTSNMFLDELNLECARTMAFLVICIEQWECQKCSVKACTSNLEEECWLSTSETCQCRSENEDNRVTSKAVKCRYWMSTHEKFLICIRMAQREMSSSFLLLPRSNLFAPP